MTGGTISHYRIAEKIGEGGMGVVYKAEDTKLERTVALKFLAAHLLADEESRRRFEREAKAAAALSHPNICTIHEIDEVEGKTFLALEFVEGESLEKKIDRGPVALKEALDIGRQVAGGLSAAHDKKIVHRDIKPGNLLITPDGRAKILDFGLALLTEGSKITQLDTTLGTVAYMSPQQAQGVKVDHRADVWALGCVLYEMVCGQRPFRGEYDQALLYEIVHEEPEPLTGLRTGVPVELEFMIGKCLAKDAEQRYQNTADMIVDLSNMAEKLKSGKSRALRTAAALGDTVGTGNLAGPSPRSGDGQAERLSLPQEADSEPTPSGVAGRGGKPLLPWALFAVAAFAFLALACVHFFETLPEAPLRRFAFTPESLYELAGRRAAISPNGRHIVYVSGATERKLWMRDLDREQPRELDGTEGAQGPFWSPDSQFIGFAADGELKKISAQGGTAITLCPLPGGNLQGGGWSPEDDLIAFGSGGPSRIYEVPARGGEPRLLFESEEGYGITGPHFLPLQAVARSIIFDFGSPTDRDIAVKNLETGEWKVLTEGAYPVYSPSGHILYQTNRYKSGLWALPFSIETLKATGEAFPIAENVGGPSVGADGALICLDFSIVGVQQLAWRDRRGNKLGVIGQPQENIRYPSLSPDEGRVAVRGYEDGNDDIWVLRTACQCNSVWRQAKLPPVSMSVNVSARQLRRDDFAKTVKRIVEQSGMRPSMLELELTESALMENEDLAASILADLSNQGIRLALDDFGTGYSSLEYLRRFPFNTLKIGQSFVAGIPHDHKSAALLEGIVATAHKLDLRVIAEGVETEKQLSFLRSRDCDWMQGYLASRPVTGEKFSELLGSRERILPESCGFAEAESLKALSHFSEKNKPGINSGVPTGAKKERDRFRRAGLAS